MTPVRRLTNILGIVRLIVLGPVLLFVATPSSAQEDGDVQYPRSAIADFYGSYTNVRITLVLRSESTNVAWAQETQWEYATTSVFYNYPARSTDRPISAYVVYEYSDDYVTWYTWGTDEASDTLPGAGPQAVHAHVDAFLPYEYVSIPGDMSFFLFNAIAEGDNRGFGFDQSARITTKFSLWNSAVESDYYLNNPYHYAGLTQDYHAESSVTAFPSPASADWQGNAPDFGSMTWAARTDWTGGDADKKIRWAISPWNEFDCGYPERLGPEPDNPYTSVSKVFCEGRGWHAFSPPDLPPIEWEVEFTYTFGNREARVLVNGCRTIFPAFEIYTGGAGSSVSGEVTLIQRTDSGNINHLFWGCYGGGSGLFTGEGVVQ